ncbi:hypothetical protein GN244_ATG18862 [Phytophthora infestans]|uniref:Uncharacterized protein n=1 Tax=Phytophthora infestans TaxID=4787 RepID=A0A833W5L0_PHYIN|nr:hypothetical protein GN244_ATG18862 [Phytophthora infestans]
MADYFAKQVDDCPIARYDSERFFQHFQRPAIGFIFAQEDITSKRVPIAESDANPSGRKAHPAVKRTRSTANNTEDRQEIARSGSANTSS